MKRIAALAVLAVLASGCTAARGTDPEFPLYVSCVTDIATTPKAS